MLLNQDISEKDNKRNFLLLFFQAFFFFLTINILDKDTVLPGLLSRMGANEIFIGLLSVITIGLPKFSQIFFGRLLQGKYVRKKYLLQGFYIRILSLFTIAYILWKYYLFDINSKHTIILLFALYTIYSLAAAYTSVGLVDIAPRCIYSSQLKKFYSLKQIGHSIVIFIALVLVKPILKIYPFTMNYSILHLIAALALIVSTIMIFGVKERIIISKVDMNLRKYFKFVLQELKKNKALLFFALIVNSEGLFLSIIPFFTTLAISQFAVNAKLIGNLFTWKIIGFLLSSTFLFLLKDYKYIDVLWINIIISVSIPFILLLFFKHILVYKLAFFLVGIFHSIYRITYEGVLFEISTDANRATYASVLGSSNISTFIVPLISGTLIQTVGYVFTFILSAVLLSLSIYFMKKLKEYKEA